MTMISTVGAPFLAALIAIPLGAELSRVWQREPTILGRLWRRHQEWVPAVGADQKPAPAPRRSALGYTLALLTYNATAYVILYGWMRISTLSHAAGAMVGGGPAHAAAVALAALTATDDGDIFARLVSIAVSGGTALTLSAALARAVIARGGGIGSFWPDLWRNGAYGLAPVILVAAALLTIGPWLAPPAVWPMVSAQIGALAFAIPPFAGVFAFGLATRAHAEGRILAVALAVGLAASAQVVAVDKAPLATGATLSWPRILLDAMLRGDLGTGLAGALAFALLVACALGPLAGRSSEYLGKRLDAADVKLVMLAAVGPLVAALCVCLAGAAALPRRPSAENLQVVMSLVRVVGRFGVAVPILALAGRLATKPRRALTAGVAPTDGLMFAGLLTATIVIIAVLVCLPAIGPQVAASRLPAPPPAQIRDGVQRHAASPA